MQFALRSADVRGTLAQCPAVMPLGRVDLAKPLSPLAWLIDGIFLQGYLNTLASLPGEGKTALLTGLTWQVSRPNGIFLGRRVSPGVTLYVDYDAPGDGRTVRYWLDKHRAAYPDGSLDKVVILEPDRDTYGLGEVELGQLEETARDVDAKLILVDAFSSAFPSTDPAKLTQVQGPLWHLRRLAFETGAAVVVVDHLPKPLSGEQAGARGPIGSVMKSAQARSVHLLSRVPLKETGGNHVLRWETTKLSYGARPAPFGVALRFHDEALLIEVAELPKAQGETRTERTIRALQDHLEAHRGQVVAHQELLSVALREGNVRQRVAAEAIKAVRARYGDELATVALPGRGKPQGYQLEAIESSSVIDTASLQRMYEVPSATDVSLMQPALHQTADVATKKEPHVPPEVLALFRRWQAGDLVGGLSDTLTGYFRKASLSAAEQAELLAIARDPRLRSLNGRTR